MNFNIGRRPLSPLHQIDSRNKIIKIASDNKTKTSHTPNKLPIIIKPPIKTQTKIKQRNNNLKYPRTKQLPSPRIGNEAFEDINEAEFPIIGEVSSSNTPQQQTTSHSIVSDQEEVHGTTVEAATNTNESNTQIKMIVEGESNTQIIMIVESTRDESKSSLLGEKTPSTNEGAMEQETDPTGKAIISEESQD